MEREPDRRTCRELARKARLWAGEAANRQDRRLAERLVRHFGERVRKRRRNPGGSPEG